MTKPGQYRETRRLLDGRLHKMLVQAGDHNVRSAFLTGSLDSEVSYVKISRAIAVVGAFFQLRDSTIPNHDDTLLSGQAIDWPNRALVGDELPALVCSHHPSLNLHTRHTDRIGQFGEHGLDANLANIPGVVSVHTCIWCATNRSSGIPLCLLDLPPAIAFHIPDDQHRLTTPWIACL